MLFNAVKYTHVYIKPNLIKYLIHKLQTHPHRFPFLKRTNQANRVGRIPNARKKACPRVHQQVMREPARA